MSQAPLTTPLLAFHERHGGKLVDFGGYLLPVQYAGEAGGIIAEHKACRTAAALFDVSHMGRSRLVSRAGASAPVIEFLRHLLPMHPDKLAVGALKYSFLLNPQGKMLDDLIVTRTSPDTFALVLNASRKTSDREVLENLLTQEAHQEVQHQIQDEETALLALQGPTAEKVLTPLIAEASRLAFMQGVEASTALGGAGAYVSRCGYTGEDGFEIALAADQADAFAEALVSNGATPAGLGARDALRLEAALPLYGHELTDQLSPLEAGLGWAVPKSLRDGGAYLGAEALAQAFANPDSVPLRRIGLLAEDGKFARLPARENTPLSDSNGRAIGTITSGSFSPALGRAIALGLVARDFATTAQPETTQVLAEVRGKHLPFRVANLPFVPHRYLR